MRDKRDDLNGSEEQGARRTGTRRRFVAASALGVAAAGLAGEALAQAAAKEADFLFVQTAGGMTFDKAASKLTLTGVASTTIMFTDRPERVAGHMRTSAFVPFWSQGKDSFLKDPPNADLSILEGEKLVQVVVTLTNPVLAGDNLSYTVKILQGDMPAKGAHVSLFIDVIGMPLTPLSYAGVARRSYRRAVMWR